MDFEMKDVYFAACSEDGGIYHYKKTEAGLELINKYGLDRPMYIAIENEKMYVIIRELDDEMSGIVSFDIREDGSLTNMTFPVSTRGKCACHLCVENGKVYTANYISGTVSLVGEKTVAHTGSGPNKPRQDMPHCHYINHTADGKYLLVCDLGNDTVYTYDKNLKEVSRALVPSGHGCRHLVMSKKTDKVYCVNELASTVTVFSIKNGVLTSHETHSALPNDFSGVSTAAAIRLSEDERYLYTSNRGDDSVAIFALDSEGMISERVGIVKIHGESPRDFDIIDGTMYVTNERTNNVTVFKVNGAEIVKTDEILEMPNPLCVVYRNAN